MKMGWLTTGMWQGRLAPVRFRIARFAFSFVILHASWRLVFAPQARWQLNIPFSNRIQQTRKVTNEEISFLFKGTTSEVALAGADLHLDLAPGMGARSQSAFRRSNSRGCGYNLRTGLACWRRRKMPMAAGSATAGRDAVSTAFASWLFSRVAKILIPGNMPSRFTAPFTRSFSGQSADTGYLPNSMYHHGFAMLALSEAYGAVDESLFPSGQKPPRSIAKALQLAMGRAANSQKKNHLGAWRYSPDSPDADTSVTGAVLMGLLAAQMPA